MENYIAAVVTAINGYGSLGYLVVFLIAVLESLAVVGTAVPGGTIIMITGFMAAHGFLKLEILPLICVAAAGAIIGDNVSYWLGTKGTQFFKEESKFLKLGHLEKGQEFFNKYGAKSIFWGRFISPLRPIVPFVAGLSSMNKKTFLIWNVASGIIWAASFLLIGYGFGASVKEVETMSTKIELILAVVPSLAATIWFLHYWQKKKKLV